MFPAFPALWEAGVGVLQGRGVSGLLWACGKSAVRLVGARLPAVMVSVRNAATFAPNEYLE